MKKSEYIFLSVTVGIIGLICLMIILQPSPAESTVKTALKYLKSPELSDESPKVFGFDYEFDLLNNYSFYRIQKFKVYTKKQEGDTAYVQVVGTTQNAFGATLERNPLFLVKKDVLGWEIIDSYRFFVFDNVPDYLEGSSDLSKYKYLKGEPQ